MPTVADIARHLEAWAPTGSAQDYDNVGLQVGRADREVSTVVTALDATPAVLQEAVAADAQLVVTHHPLLFRPPSALTGDDYVSSLALSFAEAGVALYSAHTNLDAAPGGVSFALAERLGLQAVQFLNPMDQSLLKLVTFVPEEAFDTVRAALADAGAGRIGAYDAHPYEEVAYDLYPVEQEHTRAGLGTIGTLEAPEPLSDFLTRVADRLEAGSLRYAGDAEAAVERVAVCGGAGSDLIGTARSQGADAYVTADVTYHEFFDVLATDGIPQMAVVDPGHYETEALTEDLLASSLQERFSGVDVHPTSHRTSPMKHFSPR